MTFLEYYQQEINDQSMINKEYEIEDYSNEYNYEIEYTTQE